MGDDRADRRDDSHRGAFGEFGGESAGLIDRAFRERIVLAGVTLSRGDKETTEASLDELAQLVDTAGADAVARVHQSRESPDAATYVGSGKAAEIRDVSEEHDADTVVFDDELSPAQQGNLTAILKRSALDRTAVILDIFAQNASSLEGKTQVELAQLRYRLPRLRGMGKVLSQQGGGIGTRGPGETQLEVDRRRLMRRVSRLEADLKQVRRHRATQSKARRRTSNRSVAIVGYTNSGKSTLLNRLTDAGVLVEDRLFATLDATTRRLDLPGGESVYMTDTVGFVRKLPHQLVDAFKSTLDVVVDADLLLHVVDSSDPDPMGSIDAVRYVLSEIGAADVPEMYVFNKADLAPVEAARLAGREPESVVVSASTGDGVPELLVEVGNRLRAVTSLYSLLVPFDRGDIVAMAHREGEVLSETADEDGWSVEARLDEGSAGRLAEFIVASDRSELPS
ncbi:MAG: GTPase HflX [Acidimicrobiales bacterium]|jgi:GTP-binding protein HflX|nr:GTPase HflX [Acidimicrobiales bacterium]MEE1571568.1 GTPase HflX [Acidimicrobiales bacterium]HJM27018.1 GTPase HflX [Acidimicrobiales bacterium]|tara:strand:- start:21162 stop:22520 length:1359 start_codon:yes stop_codon:yes gene_type:complete